MVKSSDHIDRFARLYLANLIELHNIRLEELQDRFRDGNDLIAMRIVAETRAIINPMVIFHEFEVVEHPITGKMTLRDG